MLLLHPVACEPWSGITDFPRVPCCGSWVVLSEGSPIRPRTFLRTAGGAVVAGGEPFSFLLVLCLADADISYCRVVGLVAVVALCLGFGLVLWPGSL